MIGVFDSETMSLRRFGKNIDFENDGSFDPGTETIRTDVPRGSKRKVKNGGDYTHYNGTAYVTVARTPFYLKERTTILNEIFADSEPEIQLTRLMEAFNNWPVLLALLDGYNYVHTEIILEKALTAEHITAADKFMIESKFPVGWASQT
tara:strand:- start:2423 stop:2869 length:447 start_codon:yes stop_codon:yes gene_type:complete